MLRQGLSTDTQAHIHSLSHWVAEQDAKAAHGQDSSNPHQVSPALSIKMLKHLLASVNSALKNISITLQPVPWCRNSQAAISQHCLQWDIIFQRPPPRNGLHEGGL